MWRPRSKACPASPRSNVTSFDSFTRLDTVLSSRHTVGGGLILFPRELRHVTMNTFRPKEVTPDFNQSGWAGGAVDRFAILPDLVLETTVSLRQFEIDVNTTNQAPMVYAPETQSGGYFNDQTRDVISVQWVEALSLIRNWRHGQHVFKFGTDLQQSHYDGSSISRPVEIRRLDGTLAERTDFGPESEQEIDGTEFAVFAQDRWRLNSRLSFELGLRFDKDAVVDRVNWSPRAGMALTVLRDGRGIIRGGFGKFVQRTPLNVGAFPSYEPRVVSRFAADGLTLGSPVAFANRLDGDLRTPEAHVGNVEWDQRFSRRLLLKLAFLGRRGSHEYILSPDAAAGALRLSSAGTSRYTEAEATVRYLGGERRDLTLSYVWARGTADLNSYDQFYGNLRNPIVRANEHNLTPTDVRHRVLLRGTIGLPAPVGLLACAGAAIGVSLVGSQRVSGFRGATQPRGTPARCPYARLLDRASVARQRAPHPCRHQGLQHLRQRRITRHPDERRVAVLRDPFQSNRAVDRVRLWDGTVAPSSPNLRKVVRAVGRPLVAQHDHRRGKKRERGGRIRASLAEALKRSVPPHRADRTPKALERTCGTLHGSLLVLRPAVTDQRDDGRIAQSNADTGRDQRKKKHRHARRHGDQRPACRGDEEAELQRAHNADPARHHADKARLNDDAENPEAGEHVPGVRDVEPESPRRKQRERRRAHRKRRTSRQSRRSAAGADAAGSAHPAARAMATPRRHCRDARSRAARATPWRSR